ncbi:hypothetical protein GCM10010193_09920 [Kitasatospora atroaurantiaca]
MVRPVYEKTYRQPLTPVPSETFRPIAGIATCQPLHRPRANALSEASNAQAEIKAQKHDVRPADPLNPAEVDQLRPGSAGQTAPERHPGRRSRPPQRVPHEPRRRQRSGQAAAPDGQSRVPRHGNGP